MKPYAKANLFVGKYKVPRDGHIRLSSEARVRYLHEIGDTDGGGKAFAETGEGPLWLIVEDGGFWPVMIELPELPTLRQWIESGVG